MDSLKELIDARNKCITDAQALQNRADAEKRKLTADEEQQWDRLYAEVDKLNVQIEERQRDGTRRDQAERMAAMLTEPPRRQITASAPGVTPGGVLGSDGAALMFDFGRGGQLSAADLDSNDRELGQLLRSRASADYRQGFLSYLRGDRRNFESLGLQVAKDPQGGYLAPISFISTLIKFLDDMVTMRRLATVLPPTTAKSVGALSYDTDYADADWTAEVPASDISEDDAARFGKREMIPNLLTKLIKTSRKLLRSSTLPLENFLAERLAYKFSITENKAFLSGTGQQRPLGVFVASNDGIPTSRDTTCASQTVFTADELIDCQESVKNQYQLNGTWVASRAFRQRCRKLKSGTGEYLLQEMMMANPAGGPGPVMSLLLGRPFMLDENAPNTFTTGQYIAVFGDYKFYWIQDGIDMEIQRLDELLALRNQVGWLGRKETDGMPVLAEAFARLKLA